MLHLLIAVLIFTSIGLTYADLYYTQRDTRYISAGYTVYAIFRLAFLLIVIAIIGDNILP